MIPFILKKNLNHDAFAEYLITAQTTNQFTNDGWAVRELELRAKYMLKIDDSKAVIATSSGTSALHAILYGMIRKDKHQYRISTSDFTFPSNSQGPASGPIIADLNSEYCINLDDQYLQESSDLVIVTNCFGHLENLDEVSAKTEGRSKKLIFDNAATPYSFWNDTNSCNLGTASYISLHHTKPLGFGEGGLAIIDREYETHVRAACNFGKLDQSFNEYGSNYKMSDISAAAILQWWDQFDINTLKEMYQNNYYKLRYEMINHEGDFWPNYSKSFFPTCLPYVFKDTFSNDKTEREVKKYYKPLRGLPGATFTFEHINCIGITEGVEDCLNK